MAIHDRLKYARQAMNLTLAEVEGRTEIGTSTLSEFENGKREPRLPQLKELADVYRRSTSFFLEDGPPPQEVVLWRQSPTSPDAQSVQAELLRFAEQYHNLESWCDEVEELDLPFASGGRERFGYAQADRLAHDFRTKYGLGERPGPSLLRVLEEVCKVKILHMPFEPTGSAACTVSERYGAAILLNSQNVRWRRNFDLGHELFHLLTWNVFRFVDTATTAEASGKEEKLATCFARNLLMPQEPLRIAIDAQLEERTRLSFDDLFEVARQFDVSVEALLWQMAFVYNLSKEVVQESIEKLRGRMSYWDKRQHDSPPHRPLRFEALANESLRKGMISTGRYAEYLGITRRQAMRQVEQEAPEDAEVEVTYS
ncbi:MAG: XRE family transcriptional regulator [Pirellulaceae bacterium]|nr:XRE family transcriptional regulator [Pirellulaceae bacterium]